MLLALVGVTGVGKSYYKEKIVENFNFEKINTIRTREKRTGEENGKAGFFMSKQELEELKRQGKIAYDFDVFGGTYAYLKDEIFSEKNMVFEMHYTTIEDWKKVREDIKTIYILPKDIEVAKNQTRKRNLSKEKEEERIKEIEEHYNKISTDEKLRSMFDYIIYNNYDEKSEKEILDLVKKMLNEGNIKMDKKYFELGEDYEKIIKNTLKDNKINEFKQISTGWTNIVYEVTTSEGNFFFRFPRDDFWARTIVKDCALSQYIYGKTDFNTVKTTLHYDNGRPYSVHNKIEGTVLADKMNDLSQDEIDKISDEISKFMYQLHSVDLKKEKIEEQKESHLKLVDFLNELLVLHVSEEDRKFWNVQEFSKKENNCLVHGDLNSSNILLDANNHVSAIIDFGFAGYGNKYFDVARIIGRCPSQFKDSIVKNYEKYSNEKLDEKVLNTEIDIWTNIDNGYINYMRKIGIYE